MPDLTLPAAAWATALAVGLALLLAILLLARSAASARRVARMAVARAAAAEQTSHGHQLAAAEADEAIKTLHAALGDAVSPASRCVSRPRIQRRIPLVRRRPRVPAVHLKAVEAFGALLDDGTVPPYREVMALGVSQKTAKEVRAFLAAQLLGRRRLQAAA